ncbi:D-aminoacyl-tRNA deacylase [Bacillus suaedae]|uniref:D-aminoacyl-tRNA deacylase n=1 Tax=Halalkalibacter suaedae TaxID=2822140 RepID=A0A940WZB6_9BACI|nr:D-aminoacyl-tRNA deacylase [Bacillus suaedae]MBP3951396.1 D-tyrosyl-tRNA(Tyr) deacylase [Bacillus suaedae]
MRVVLQRTKQASVSVDGEIVGQIDKGLTLLVGITHEDTLKDIQYLAEKIVHLRIFEDAEGKMNHSLKDMDGQILSISQFTLYGDTRKGRRPNFMDAAKPDVALLRYEEFNEALRSKGIVVETGTFGAMMDVSLVNDGPVTLILES